MGCGSSKTNPGGDMEAATPRPNPNKPHGDVKWNQKNNIDTNANISDTRPVPKSVAFEVVLDENKSESLIKKHPPLRLQKLEPLSMPLLTPEMLAEKQRLADEKRERELQRKASASKKKSQRRREIAKAQEIAQEIQQKEVLQREKTVENLRSAKLAEIQEKQRIQEERRKRARERAKKLNQEDQQEVGMIEVEKDDHYNADDDDSWLTRDMKPTEPEGKVDSSSEDTVNVDNTSRAQQITSQTDDFFDT